MIAELARRLLTGERRALAQAITLVESTRADQADRRAELLDTIMAHTGGAVRLGISGTPGVGKSTFIDTLGAKLVADGRRLAVLAVDPTSQTAGGSILGDKTRMANLASSPNAYIRPSPSGGITGGVAAATRDAVLLCEAAGYDTVFVETVGVGQSETAVADLTDVFLLLLAPAGGDDLQGIKRGVMELADVIAVNKADGPLGDLARTTASHYRQALHLVRPKRAGEQVPVLTCSSLSGSGIGEVWDTIEALHQRLDASGELRRLRTEQALRQLDAQVRANLYAYLTGSETFDRARRRVRVGLVDGTVSATSAATTLTRAAIEQLSPNDPTGTSGH